MALRCISAALGSKGLIRVIVIIVWIYLFLRLLIVFTVWIYLFLRLLIVFIVWIYSFLRLLIVFIVCIYLFLRLLIVFISWIHSFLRILFVFILWIHLFLRLFSNRWLLSYLELSESLHFRSDLTGLSVIYGIYWNNSYSYSEDYY